MEPIRVMLVDNEGVFREGLARLLNEQPQIKVVCQCGDSKEAVANIREMKPEIILVDSQISEGKVLEAVKEICQSLPGAKVVMITHPEAPASALDMLRAGAKACLARTISVPDLIKSIELVTTGRIVICPPAAQKFLDEIISAELADTVKDAAAVLSGREIEIAKLIARGATNREIATSLFITESTVKVHVKNILNKLELRNRQQLAVYAVLQSWFSSTEAPEEKRREPVP